MNKKIKVSVIVVSLNTLIDFKKTINSINSQTFKKFEIIVIDGGSTDGTKKEIKKNKNSFSNYLIERDNGIYHAMNKGIKLSKGKWIIFMNSGDTFHKKKTLENFFSEDVKEHDIIYGDTIVNSKKLKYLVESTAFDNKTLSMPFCHQSVFVKSILLKKKNFSLIYKYSSDFEFFFNCFERKKKFKRINMIISNVKSGGLADKNRQKVFDENLMIISKKNNKLLTYILYLKKLNQYLIDFLKTILPDFVQKIILKIKYKNVLID